MWGDSVGRIIKLYSRRKVLFQKCNHPSIHSYIHQVLRTYSTYNNTIQNCWESLFLFNHLTLLWSQCWQPNRWVKRKNNPSMLQNCLWSSWQRLLVFLKYQVSSFFLWPFIGWMTNQNKVYISMHTLFKSFVCVPGDQVIRVYWKLCITILDIFFKKNNNK